MSIVEDQMIQLKEKTSFSNIFPYYWYLYVKLPLRLWQFTHCPAVGNSTSILVALTMFDLSASKWLVSLTNTACLFFWAAHKIWWSEQKNNWTHFDTNVETRRQQLQHLRRPSRQYCIISSIYIHIFFLNDKGTGRASGHYIKLCI